MATARRTRVDTAAKTGDRRKTLEAMRDKLATDMEEAPPAVVAQIAGRLSAVMAELDALPAEERSRSDELAERRKARRTAAKVASTAAGDGVKRRS